MTYYYISQRHQSTIAKCNDNLQVSNTIINTGLNPTAAHSFENDTKTGRRFRTTKGTYRRVNQFSSNLFLFVRVFKKKTFIYSLSVTDARPVVASGE